PRIEVVRDADALLARLAAGSDDLTQVALLEAPPASGFTGTAGAPGAAGVRFGRGQPEGVPLGGEAPAARVLVLSDQYAPGWQATVNGRAVPIERANYAFRAVQVPSGRTLVEFRYAPRSLTIGALISALSLVVVAVLSVVAWRR